MESSQISRRQLLKAAGVIGITGSAWAPNVVFAGENEQRVRWDIVSVDFTAGTVSAGGHAFARAEDDSRIRLTGSGTFTVDGNDVTGGGTWRTFAAAGGETDRGDYEVTDLVDWNPAPGTPPPLRDLIDEGRPSAGLVFLAIEYSNGETGVLAVSCSLIGSPPSVFEGIHASMGFTDFWKREEPPSPPGNANRTLFHVSGDDPLKKAPSRKSRRTSR